MARPGCRYRLVVSGEAMDNSSTRIHVSMRTSGEDEKEKHPQHTFSLSKVIVR
jgi:hypothetical protein